MTVPGTSNGDLARQSTWACPEAATTPIRAQTLDAARQAVLSERNKSYGAPEDSFGDIAALWSVILRRKISKAQVALCLDAVKTARLMTNPAHRDSWVDKAGYAACGAEVAS